MRSDRSLATLIGARCVVEAVLFTALASIAHAATQGRDALPALSTALTAFGAAVLLCVVLRETGTERRSATIIVITLAIGVGWGLTLPTSGADGFNVLSRITLFGLLSEAALWRVVSVARGPAHWTDIRNAMPVTGTAIAIAVLWPGTIDRAPYAPLALLTLAASGLALSIARSAEELELARGSAGKMRASSATGVTVVIGTVAIVVAALMPTLQDALGALGEALAPAIGRVLFLLLLPLGYLAGFIVEVVRSLMTGPFKWPRLPTLEVTPEQDAEMLRQMEQTRPYLIGAIELFVVAIAVLVGLVLFDRMLRERRHILPTGVTLERELAEGLGLMDTLRSLRPRRAPRRRGPREDGTAAGAVRVMYWRFLSLAHARGAGWREEPETPTEHARRISALDGRWGEADPIVHAFEGVRYGEVVPDDRTVAAARAALTALEARPR